MPYRSNDANASDVARALGGRRVGDGWLCRCPVQGHGRGRGDTNPSLRVSDGDDRLLVYCFAGCRAEKVFAALRQRGFGKLAPLPGRQIQSSPPANDNEAQSARALAIRDPAEPAGGSPAERYLRSRGIVSPIPPAIRWQPIADRQVGQPAMVALVETMPSKMRAVQLTYLTSEGRKADSRVPRRTIGALQGGAVRLAEPGECLGGAEGTEDALASMQAVGIPCWASLGAARMRSVAIPDCVTQLHLFADNDEAGLKGVEQTKEVHTRRGRTVVIRVPPPPHKDWAAYVEMQSRKAA